MLNSKTLTIALVDDSDLAVAGICALIEPYADRVRLVEIREALAHPETLDAILYEPIEMSGMSTSVLRDLQRLSDAPTAVFTWGERGQLPTPIARPLLSKRLAASQFVRAVEDLVEGRLQVPEEVAEPAPVVVATPAPVATTTIHESGVDLTRREADVIGLITAGCSNIEIGTELGLSVNSVKTYIRTAYRKIEVDRRSQAMLWGLAHGFADSREAATA